VNSETKYFIINCLRIFSIILFLVLFLIYHIVKLKVVTSDRVNIYIPGEYCLYVLKEKAEVGGLKNNESSCSDMIVNNSSFSFAKGIFIPVKVYSFDTIGEHSLNIAYKPEFYFITNSKLEGISFLAMFFLVLAWFFSIRFYFRDFGKKRYW